MAYTTHISQQIITYFFGSAAITRPTSWTAALYNGHPDAAGVESTDANYVAQAVTFTIGDTDANGRTEAKNAALITYPAVAAADTVTHVVIKDQAANLVAALELAAPRSLAAGEVFSIPAGEMVIKGE